jgi:nicotinamide-nucleotide adenylyltransferase
MWSTLNPQRRALEALASDTGPSFALTSRNFENPPLRLAVLDSSFNPPTLAHRRLVEETTARFACDHRLLLLAKANVDKTVSGAPLSHRLRMMELLARDMGDTSVGVTAHGRFVDKARALSQAFRNQTRLLFILGYDTAVRLFDPKYYDDMKHELGALFERADIVYANRGHHDMAACLALKDSPAAQPFRSRLHLIELPEPYASLSSTEARRRLAAGGIDADRILPPVIRAYLSEHPFYRDGAR